jgi:Arc/MetJ-type ribon-helix-helix transcriptional regulator
MDGERISLRLEADDLELMDAFIVKHPEYSNRSNFARMAIRSFIDNFNGIGTVENAKIGVKENVLTVEVPRYAHDTIMSLVRAGIYNTPEDALVECIRKEFIDTRKILEDVKRERMENLKGTVQMTSE